MNKIITFLICIAVGLTADGKIGGVTYCDFIYSDTDDSTAFNFQRQYFSYAIDMSDDIKFTLVFDVDRTNKLDGEDARLVAFLKKAQIEYKTSIGKVSMGLIGMNTHAVQEKNWGNRFIEKSAMDKNKYSTSADLGIGFSRRLKDDLNISLQIVNGEGYKEPQGDKQMKISFNTTYGEVNLNKNDGYNAGIVYSTEGLESAPDKNMISAFGGFSGKGSRLGAEYDLLHQGNTESNIISISSNYDITEYLDAFVRYDIYDPDTKYTYKIETYIEEDKGRLSSNYLISGILFNCGNGLSVAPNVRMTFIENGTKDLNEYKINFQYIF